jgi:hypothetical protein
MVPTGGDQIEEVKAEECCQVEGIGTMEGSKSNVEVGMIEVILSMMQRLANPAVIPYVRSYNLDELARNIPHEFRGEGRP